MCSHLQLLEFEGSLALKLRFHIFNFSNLNEASHQSLIFTAVCLQLAMEWLRQGSSLLQLHASGGLSFLRYAAESRISHCNGSVRRVNGAVAAIFSILVVMIFLQNSF